METSNQAVQAGQEQGNPQEVMQVVKQMLEQGAQPTEIVMALINDYQMAPEQILQLLVEMGMPEAEAQQTIEAAIQGDGQPQGAGEESMEGAESNPQEEAKEQPEMKFGGPTKKDFKSLAKDMIVTFRKGGETKEDALDTSDTQSYVENLKGAISNYLAKNNAIATVKKRAQNNMALFNEMPTAKNGIQITDEQLKTMQTQDPTMTREKFAELDEDIANSWVNPTNNTADNLKNKPTASTEKEEKKTFDPNKNYRYVNGEFVENKDESTTINEKTTEDDYNGVQAKTVKSLSGKELDTQRFLTSPVGQMFGAIGNKKATGNIQAKGFGKLAGADPNELSKMLSSGQFNVSSIEDVRRKGIFGREKRRDTDMFGNSNVIGKRVYFGEPGSGTSTPASLSASTSNPSGIESKNRNLDEYLAENKISRADYDNNVGNVKNAVDKEFGINTPTTGSQVGNQTTKPALTEDQRLLEFRDMVTKSQSDNRFDRKQSKEWFKEQKENEGSIEDDKKVTTTGYVPEGTQSGYGESRDANDKEILDYAKTLGLTEEQLKNSEVYGRVLDDMEGVKPFKEQTNSSNITTTPMAGSNNSATQLGDKLYPDFDYKKASSEESVIQAKKAWVDQNIQVGGGTQQTRTFPDGTLAVYDHVKGQYIPAIQQKKHGGPVWDWKTMKFVNGGTIPLAKDGAETYINILPEYEREVDFSAIGQGVYGIGDGLNRKLSAYRERTPKTVATAERSTDNLFNEAAPDSGDKGYYDENGRWIPTDAGARVLAGTGTDQSVYGQFTNKNFYDDFISNNVRSKNGGLIRAANGVQIGDEMELTDEDYAEFQRLGYNVKRIG